MSSPVIVIDKDLVRSKAFRSLANNGTAILILVDFLMKRQVKRTSDQKGKKHMIVTNNGEIEYCFSEAEKKGITRPAFNRNRDILIDRGFIDIIHSGQGGKKGDKSLYALSERWRKWGTDTFIAKSRAKDKRSGIGFQLWHARKNIGNADVTPTSNADVTPKKKISSLR